MLQRWKRLTSAVLFENPWWTYKRDTFQIPNGIAGEYHYVHTNGAALVIPVTAEGRLVLINQYRFLCDRESIELPCGGVKPGKTPEEMAKIELEEESGFTCNTMTYIGSFNPFNGVTTEMCSVFVAQELSPVTVACDPTEEFEVLTRTLDEVEAMCATNEIWDGMTMAALALARTFLKRTLKQSA